jgi:hypothetical protein
MSDSRPFANRQDKPADDAPLFALAAWWMADYAELWYTMGPNDFSDEGQECFARCQEIEEVGNRLRDLHTGWEAAAGKGELATAAQIIAGLLSQWKLPGAVYWSAQARRWRVVGAEYRPQADDVLVGVYAPGADAQLLREDLEAVAT